jgi:hypothetical protein
MKVCYVDESGDTQPIWGRQIGIITPVCAVLGVVFDQASLSPLTQEFLNLKRQLFPHLLGRRAPHLAWVLAEVKGADIRRGMREGLPRRNRRHSVRVLDALVGLLEDYEAKVFGRVWVKGIGEPVDGRALHTFSMQAICTSFERHLRAADDVGLVIADSNQAMNVHVSHSIFTQKFKLAGDEYARILEMPTFGHSENHVGIQIADLLASALVFPMATYAFCTGHVEGVHVDAGFGQLAERYGERLKDLQFRFADGGRTRGGIVVDEKIGHTSGSRLFTG